MFKLYERMFFGFVLMRWLHGFIVVLSKVWLDVMIFQCWWSVVTNLKSYILLEVFKAISENIFGCTDSLLFESITFVWNNTQDCGFVLMCWNLGNITVVVPIYTDMEMFIVVLSHRFVVACLENHKYCKLTHLSM